MPESTNNHPPASTFTVEENHHAIPASHDLEDDPPPPAFPLLNLPPPLFEMAEEVARVNGVPVELPAMCCLATASAAIGAGLCVRSIHEKTTHANIMVLIAAETGSGKSEVYRACAGPFQKCQELIHDEWRKDTLPRARAEHRLLENEIKLLEREARRPGADRPSVLERLRQKEEEKDQAATAMQQPFFIGSDFTTPQLIRTLARMDGQFFTASSDAKNVIDMLLGRYNEGSTDEEVYLKGFSCEPLDRHRVGDGSHSLPRACIASLWLTQPDKLARMLAERALSEGGLLPRLLTLQVHCPPLRVRSGERGVSTTTAGEYHQLIHDLFRHYRQHKDEPLVIDCEPAARAELEAYQNTIADRRETDLKDITGFAARWAEHAWRLSLIVHAAWHKEEAHLHPLHLSSAKSGIALAQWCAAQQMDLLHQGRSEARQKLYDKVLRLVQDKGQIVASDVYTQRITPRGTPEMAHRLLAEMAGARILECHHHETGRKNHTQLIYTGPGRRLATDL